MTELQAKKALSLRAELKQAGDTLYALTLQVKRAEKKELKLAENIKKRLEKTKISFDEFCKMAPPKLLKELKNDSKPNKKSTK